LLDTKDTDKIVETILHIAPTFAGINLEDISAPRCFEIERRLKEKLNIPVFHDDQHGTAVVTLAGLFNALRVVGKKLENVKIVINGAGAAGLAVARLLLTSGARHIVLCDREGAIYEGRAGLNPEKTLLAALTNKEKLSGDVNKILAGQDVFIGVSTKDVLTAAAVQSMNKDPIVFAMANPDPEIKPELIADSAAVIATGRSDYPNQINNVLCFPGMFKGAFAARATDITRKMCLAAARAIAACVAEKDLSKDNIIPSVFDKNVAENVAAAVAEAWKRREKQ
jgi:malate dehydrogenase (oxaloacetate-decarboxylating)